MFILNIINNIIYKTLKESNDKNIKKLTGIYTYLPKNTIFPYLFIECTNINKNNDYLEDIYNISVCLNIYDNNNSNINILEIVNSVKNEILKINNDNIIDVNLINIKNSFNNELIPYFKSLVNFEITTLNK